MSRAQQLSAWTYTLSTHLPHLSKSCLFMLAAWSFALVWTQSAGTSTVASFLARLWSQKFNTTRQRLREFYLPANKKRGHKRKELDVTTCFAPLLRWIIANWPDTHPQLPLAIDTTLLGNRFAILVCAVLYRGCAIPIAWKVLDVRKKGAWKPHWLALLAQLNDIVPSNWTVLVLADRGLYADWLYKSIVANGWHPYLRLRRCGQFRLKGQTKWRELDKVLDKAGQEWSGQVECFKREKTRLNCTLMARWEEGQKEPWIVMTDLAAEQADIVWYGLRAWIESGFKDTKRGGWHWEQTKMVNAERIERHWLVMAVGMLWVVSVGGESAVNGGISGVEQTSWAGTGYYWPEATAIAGVGDEGAPEEEQGGGKMKWIERVMSCFRLGVVVVRERMVEGGPMDIVVFWPQQWPRARERGALKWMTFLEPVAETEPLAA